MTYHRTSYYNNTYCPNAQYGDDPPGHSTTCAFSVYGNNTAILKQCCRGSPVGDFSVIDSLEPQYCKRFQYCNFTGLAWEESSIYKCLDDSPWQDRSICRNEKRESGAPTRLSSKLVLLVMILMTGGFALHVGV